METDSNVPQPIDDEFVKMIDAVARAKDPQDIAAIVCLRRDGPPQLFYAPQASHASALSYGAQLEYPAQKVLQTDTIASISVQSNPTCYWVIINGRPAMICFP